MYGIAFLPRCDPFVSDRVCPGCRHLPGPLSRCATGCDSNLHRVRAASASETGAGLERDRHHQGKTRYSLLIFLIALWCLPYLIYAAGTRDFRWSALLKLFALAAVPVLIYSRFPPRRLDVFSWQDFAVAVLLIGFVLTGQMTGIWNVPVNLDFLSRLFLIAVASWCWTFIRVVPELGYSFRISREVHAGSGPLRLVCRDRDSGEPGHALHPVESPVDWPYAVPVELSSDLPVHRSVGGAFFRGFLQSLLSKSLGSWVAGQALVSVLFGLFHILHPPVPNWPYVALATVAGWFYGSAFRKTGSLMTSSLVHAGVDTVWRTWMSAR